MVIKYEEKVEKLMNEMISISLPYKPEYVSIARLTASAIANKMGFNIEEIEDIKVAISEACNNAVLHGKKNEHNFDIEFTVEANRFIIEVQDRGKGFEVNKCPNPDLCNPKESGLGIFIIKSLMDEVDICSNPGKGTEIKMIKFLQEDI